MTAAGAPVGGLVAHQPGWNAAGLAVGSLLAAKKERCLGKRWRVGCAYRVGVSGAGKCASVSAGQATDPGMCRFPSEHLGTPETRSCLHAGGPGVSALGTVKCSQCRALPCVPCAAAAALEGSSDQPWALCLSSGFPHHPLPCLPPSPPVTAVSLVESGRIAMGAVLLLVSRALFILISIYYYYQVGRRPKKV